MFFYTSLTPLMPIYTYLNSRGIQFVGVFLQFLHPFFFTYILYILLISTPVLAAAPDTFRRRLLFSYQLLRISINYFSYSTYIIIPGVFIKSPCTAISTYYFCFLCSSCLLFPFLYPTTYLLYFSTFLFS